MIRSVLVPLDGSPFGEHALPLALAVARRAGASLQLVHVHQSVPPASVAGVTVADAVEVMLRQEEQAYLDDMAKHLPVSVPVRTTLLDGAVAQAIHNRAAANGVDLVVLATHGRGALGRFWLGSVTDELIRLLPMPALLVRPREGGADLEHEPALRHVLLPLDGSELAEQILGPALALGGLLGCRYTLLRVVKPALRPAYLPEGTTIAGLRHDAVGKQLGEWERRLEEEARAYLEGVAGRLSGQGLEVQTRVVVDEQPAQAILREAQVRGADLIALETHGRRTLARLLLGSVADKVIRGTHLPVLVHRPLQG
jgi:nucleotide-binding universal stress UspA family protein